MAHKLEHPLFLAPSSRPESESRPQRVLLLCAESLRPAACCVEDALRARGWSTRLEIGRRARRWVRRAPPGPAVLRVLLVPEQLDPSVVDKLRTGTDPTNRGGLQVVSCDTPRGVVQEIERLAGFPSFVRRNPAPPRAVLAHPTLCEQAVYRDQRWLVGAAAAVAAFSAGWVTTAALQPDAPQVSRRAPALSAPAATSQPKATPSYVDEPMFTNAAVTADDLAFEDDELAFDEDFEVTIEDNDEEFDWDPEVADDEILIWDETPTPMITARKIETFDAGARLAALGSDPIVADVPEADIADAPDAPAEDAIPEEAAPLEVDPDAFAPMLATPASDPTPPGPIAAITGALRPFVPIQIVLPNAPKPVYTIDPFADY